MNMSQGQASIDPADRREKERRKMAGYDPDDRRAGVRRTVLVLLIAITVILGLFLLQFLH